MRCLRSKSKARASPLLLLTFPVRFFQAVFAFWQAAAEARGMLVENLVTDTVGVFARAKRPNIEIIARAHYDDEVTYIMDRGADKVVMGEREIANSMLSMLQVDLPAGEEERQTCPI